MVCKLQVASSLTLYSKFNPFRSIPALIIYYVFFSFRGGGMLADVLLTNWVFFAGIYVAYFLRIYISLVNKKNLFANVC